MNCCKVLDSRPGLMQCQCSSFSSGLAVLSYLFLSAWSNWANTTIPSLIRLADLERRALHKAWEKRINFSTLIPWSFKFILLSTGYHFSLICLQTCNSLGSNRTISALPSYLFVFTDIVQYHIL